MNCEFVGLHRAVSFQAKREKESMKRCSLTILMVLLGSSSGLAATWTDPEFEQLVKISPLIALIEAAEKGPKDHIQQFKIVKTYRGKKNFREISVTGFFDPERQRAPKIASKTRFVAFLNKKGRLWRPATPSYGLFPVRGDKILASARDTSLRMAIKLDRYEEFLSAVIPFVTRKKSPDPRWLKRQRQAIDGSPLIALDAGQAGLLHFALEALYYFATKKDEPRLKRVLGCDLFQIRASVMRALSAIATESVAQLLLDRASQDSKDTVKCWAALSLARLSPFPKKLIPVLIARVEKLDAKDVTLHRHVEDPRRNALPSPQACLLRFLGQLKDKSALPVLFRALENRHEELIKAALHGILNFADKDLARKIIEKMRPEKAEDHHYNQYFVTALRQLTGQKFGSSRRAWLDWWNKKAGAARSQGPGQK
jgi:hypothetical protein